VNYRKLNTLIKKNRYLLFLIDKTLEKLRKTRVFTKLNIRQAFHQIRINLKLENLIIFRTRYRAYKYKILLFGLINKPVTF
jgi:hypothetical protein